MHTIMQACCECVCDLYGCHDIEDDLRGALLMADHFEDRDNTAVLVDEDLGDAEVQKVQERASMLAKFVSLMEEGLKDAARSLPGMREQMLNLEFNYTYDELPPFLGYIVSKEGRATEPRELQSATLALTRATLLISKPSLIQQSESRMSEAVVAEVEKIFIDLFKKIKDAAADASAEGVKPAPDVTDAEWAQFKAIVEGISVATLEDNPLVDNWYTWLQTVLQLRETKDGLVAKRNAAKKAKEQLQAIHEKLDAAGSESPFSLALMHTVAQAAKDASNPLTREQLLWALGRAKGSEQVAISLATSQTSARRALRVLRQPTLLAEFDVGVVSAPMVRKVKETLKGDVLKRPIDELDLLDEEAGEGGGRKPNKRPEEGDTVTIVSAKDEAAAPYIGRVGKIIEDDETDQPFNVDFGMDDTWWFHENEVEVSELLRGLGGDDDEDDDEEDEGEEEDDDDDDHGDEFGMGGDPRAQFMQMMQMMHAGRAPLPPFGGRTAGGSPPSRGGDLGGDPREAFMQMMMATGMPQMEGIRMIPGRVSGGASESRRGQAVPVEAEDEEEDGEDGGERERESGRKKGKRPKKREEARHETKTESKQDRRCRGSRHGGSAGTCTSASGGDANVQPRVEAAYGY